MSLFTSKRRRLFVTLAGQARDRTAEEVGFIAKLLNRLPTKDEEAEMERWVSMHLRPAGIIPKSVDVAFGKTQWRFQVIPPDGYGEAYDTITDLPRELQPLA